MRINPRYCSKYRVPWLLVSISMRSRTIWYSRCGHSCYVGRFSCHTQPLLCLTFGKTHHQARTEASERAKRVKSRMPGNKKKNKGNKAKNATARSNAANKDDLAGLDDLLR